MQINITARDFGGTEFLAQPHRLHLGAQKAEGVDRLEFSLPEQWNGCVVTLHIRHADGTLAEPLALDETGCVSAWAGVLPAGPAVSGCWPLPTAMATPPTPGPVSTTSTASSPPRARAKS